KVRDVAVHRLGEPANHPVPACRRLEEERLAVHAIYNPRMLAVGARLTAQDHSPDIKFGVDADVGQLAPGPQREILAVPAAQLLERDRMLPEIPLVELR